MSEELTLRFDPQTIEHLGIKMYSQLPYALAELVANSYDAGASKVDILLDDSDLDYKKIVISDNGEGMSFDEVQEKFLVIGRKRRDSDPERINSKGRRITGRKGLGKLALFGIGKTIHIETTRKGEKEKTVFIMDWDNIINSSGEYHPESSFVEKDNIMEEGTVISLSKLSRVTAFNLENTANSLSKLFNCFDSDFEVKITNRERSIPLTRELRYESINKEFEWDIEDIADNIESDYEHNDEVKGKIVSSITPMKPELRGITLYVNGRLANIPSFFGYSEAGHTFSYISGWIDVDFLDELGTDIISTDRQSLSWDMPEASDLQSFLHKIIKYLIKDWSSKRKEAKEARIAKRSGINTREWYEKVPEDIRPKLRNVVDNISKKPELSDEDFSSVVHHIHDLIPPYTYYHYRLLHGEIQDASDNYYKEGNYYQAFLEAMKRYKNAVKDKSGIKESEDYQIVSKAFGRSSALITTSKYKKRPNGMPFSEPTLENIEEGQKFLSMGVVCGGRNVVSHEEINDLKISELFTEKDCLDMLSLLSHLFKRLEESEKSTE